MPWDDLPPDPNSASPEEAAQWWDENWVGTHRTNCEFLRGAAGSCFVAAFEAVGQAYSTWSRNVDQQRPAEASFVLILNYQHRATGPLLAAVLQPAIALESFVQLCALVALSPKTDGALSLSLTLNGFDSRSFEERAKLAAELAGADAIPRELVQDVRSLISFRNGCVHDKPMLHGPSGSLVGFGRGGAKLIDEASLFGGTYPLLNDSNFPLRVSHARKAVEVHDRFVSHVLDSSSTGFRTAFEQQLAPIHDSSHFEIRDWIPNQVWDKAEDLGSAFDEAVQWSESIPREETEDFILGLKRRVNLRVEDSEERE